MAKNTKPAQPSLPPEHPPQLKQPTLPKDPPAPPKQSRAKAALEYSETTNSAASVDVSPAKAMQEQSVTPPTPEKISITLRTEQSYEYNLDLPREVVEKLLDPDVGDGFIEVPGVSYGGQRLHGVRRFLHTSYIKEIDVKGM